MTGVPPMTCTGEGRGPFRSVDTDRTRGSYTSAIICGWNPAEILIDRLRFGGTQLPREVNQARWRGRWGGRGRPLTRSFLKEARPARSRKRAAEAEDLDSPRCCCSLPHRPAGGEDGVASKRHVAFGDIVCEA